MVESRRGRPGHRPRPPHWADQGGDQLQAHHAGHGGGKILVLQNRKREIIQATLGGEDEFAASLSGMKFRSYWRDGGPVLVSCGKAMNCRLLPVLGALVWAALPAAAAELKLSLSPATNDFVLVADGQAAPFILAGRMRR